MLLYQFVLVIFFKHICVIFPPTGAQVFVNTGFRFPRCICVFFSLYDANKVTLWHNLPVSCLGAQLVHCVHKI